MATRCTGPVDHITEGIARAPAKQSNQKRFNIYLNIQQVKNLLKGNLNPVIQHFKNEMKEQSVNLGFEKAELNPEKKSVSLKIISPVP